MRGAALAFVIEHWEFFAGFIVFGVTSALILSGIKRANAVREAAEEAKRSRELDAEMAKIREGLGPR